MKSNSTKNILFLSVILFNFSYCHSQIRFIELKEKDRIITTPKDLGRLTAPFFIDWDGDGDSDMVCGDEEGKFHYLENEENFFTELIEDNPFKNLDVGSGSVPFLVDFDNDSDLDLLSGNSEGRIRLYLNEQGSFEFADLSVNPFFNFDVGNRSTPVLIDLDNDSDLDLVSGSSFGTFHFFKNEGGVFIEIRDASPFSNVSVSNSSPDFMDMDLDGDLDMISGSSNGAVRYYENMDGIFSFKFTLAEAPNARTGRFTVPRFIQLGIGDSVNIVAGNLEGRFDLFEYNGESFVLSTRGPFFGFDVGFSSTPILGDWFNDGSINLISGNSDGRLRLFEIVNGEMKEILDLPSPLDRNFFENAEPKLFDLDFDGDLDLIVSSSYLNSSSLRSILNSAIPNERFPFFGFSSIRSRGEKISFGIMGNKEDSTFSVLVSEEGVFRAFDYYRFTSNSLNIIFDQPFRGIRYNTGFVSPTFVDLDLDNDMDLVFGEGFRFRYFENLDGDYIERRGSENPFSSILLKSIYANTSFFDIDQDGDLDMVIGCLDGTFKEFRNVSSIITGLSSKKPIKNTILIYPNPTKKILNLNTKGYFEIYDQLGKKQISGINENEIDVSGLEAGIYVIRMGKGQSTFTKE